MPEESDASSSALGDLVRAASELSLSLTEAQVQQFGHYCRLLRTANQNFNLTALRSEEEIMKGLILDSLTVCRVLTPLVATREAGTVRFVDVGSGAGIPGLPLKIVYPQWSLVLVESIGKKATFLRSVVSELRLTEVFVLQARAEELGGSTEWRDSADLCTARAVGRLPTLLELCAPLVKAGGLLVFPKGRNISAEVEQARPAMKALKLKLKQVTDVSADLGLREERVIVMYEKVGPTPSGYPRRVGLAKARPIGVLDDAVTGHPREGRGRER